MAFKKNGAATASGPVIEVASDKKASKKDEDRTKDVKKPVEDKK